MSSGFFSLLGTPPALGRDFSLDDDRDGAGPTVILTYGLWQNSFGGDPGIVGRPVRLNDRDYTVIGVAARDFWFYSPADLFVPMSTFENLYRTNRYSLPGTPVRLRARCVWL